MFKIMKYFCGFSPSKYINKLHQKMLINSRRSHTQKKEGGTLTGKLLLLIYLSFFNSLRNIFGSTARQPCQALHGSCQHFD